eukprot:g46922.t1
MWEQAKALQEGAEIVVCTPGRLIDHVKKKATNLQRVTYLVFDEADRMFDMGFEYQVRSLANHVRPDRQTLLFSATFRKKIERLARDILVDPIRVVQGDIGEVDIPATAATTASSHHPEPHLLRPQSFLTSQLSNFHALSQTAPAPPPPPSLTNRTELAVQWNKFWRDFPWNFSKLTPDITARLDQQQLVRELTRRRNKFDLILCLLQMRLSMTVLDITAGVSQGSVLELINFSCFINDLSSVVRSEVGMFADDYAMCNTIFFDIEAVLVQMQQVSTFGVENSKGGARGLQDSNMVPLFKKGDWDKPGIAN